MPVYPFNNCTLHWNAPDGSGGTFRPSGPMYRHGSEVWFIKNPADWTSKKTMSARLVVGFSVGDKPTYELDDLVDLVGKIRERQAHDPSASFVSQKGIYQHRDGKRVVHEDGAQVFILNLTGASAKQFQADMVALAEEVAAEFQQEFQQEAVILDIQVNGITQKTMGISAERPKSKKRR